MIFSKKLFSLLGAALDVASILPYAYGIVRGGVRPHFFSWLIWVVVMAVGWYAQRIDGGGAGTWVLGTSLFTTSTILVLAFLYGERHGKPGDWVCLVIALASVPLWITVSDPLPSVLLITGIDLIGYGPTIRKAWSKPQEELMLLWSLGALKFVFAIVGLESYSLTTWLYPAAIALANSAVVLILLVRRPQ